jgi:hypothetical protein
MNILNIPDWILFYSLFPIMVLMFPIIIISFANKLCNIVQKDQWIMKKNY